MQPFGSGLANRAERSPSASIASSSPGSTSRTNEAPTMSSAAVSLATTQPRDSRPSTSGRTPCGVRGRRREQPAEQVGVGGGAVAGDDAGVPRPLEQLGGVHQVAVVPQGQPAADRGGAERRLSVLPGGGAGGGVAAVPDRDVP